MHNSLGSVSSAMLTGATSSAVRFLVGFLGAETYRRQKDWNIQRRNFIRAETSTSSIHKVNATNTGVCIDGKIFVSNALHPLL